MSTILTDDLIIKQRQLALLRKKRDLRRKYGLPFYSPYPKQEAFHRAAMHRRRMFRAGNRTGKSTTGVAEDCSFLMGERPFFTKSDPGRKLGIPAYPTKGIVITTDWDKVDEIFTGQGVTGKVGKIWTMLPRDFVVKTHRNHSGVIDRIECANGHQATFDTVKSFMSNPMGSESSDYDWGHFDEPLPQTMYKAITRGGMDRGMKMWFTMTPLSEMWINDMFFPDPTKQIDYSKNSYFENPERSSWAVQASTWDNPYLSSDDVADFENELTEEERQCRIMGYPLALSGLIYKSFSLDEHVYFELTQEMRDEGWHDINTPPRHYTLYYSIDTHPKTPHAAIFVWVSPEGVSYIADEFFAPYNAAELAEAVKSRFRNYTIGYGKVEPGAWIPDASTKMSLAENLITRGLTIEKASKNLSFGIIHMNTRFRERILRANGTTTPSIKVAANCQRFLFEIMRYSYDPKTNKPVDKDDHIMEAMYRLFINDPAWTPPIEDNPVGELAIVDPLSYEDDFSDDWSLN